VVCVKGNQKGLRDVVAEVFEQAGEAEFAGCSMASSSDDAHGRHEERYVAVVRNPKGLPAGWKDEDRYTWVVLVDSPNARELNDLIWTCYPISGLKLEIEKDTAWQSLRTYWSFPLREQCLRR
jgi:hypothetical protein